MHDELLDIEIKKSPMWEINNPRVNALIRATMDIVFNVLISCVRIYGDPDLIKKEMLNDETS